MSGGNGVGAFYEGFQPCERPPSVMLLERNEAPWHLGSYGGTLGSGDGAIIRFRRKGRAGMSVVRGEQMENQFPLGLIVKCLIVPCLDERTKLVSVSCVIRVIEVSLTALSEWFASGIPNRSLPPATILSPVVPSCRKGDCFAEVRCESESFTKRPRDCLSDASVFR